MILVRVYARSRTDLRARHWSRSCDSSSRGLNRNCPRYTIRGSHRTVAGAVRAPIRRMAHALHRGTAVHPLHLRRRQLRSDARRAAPLFLIPVLASVEAGSLNQSLWLTAAKPWEGCSVPADRPHSQRRPHTINTNVVAVPLPCTMVG